MTTSQFQGRPYALISTDGHAGAHPADYRPYLERRWHDEFDAWLTAFTDPWWEIDPDSNYKAGVASYVDPINWESTKRLELLESFGIVGEVIFPNTAQPFYPTATLAAAAPRSRDEYERRWAGLQAHNRWLVDFCNDTPGRRYGLVQLFLDDVDAAVAEVRWAKDAGLKGVLLPPDHHLNLINLYYPSLEPLWATCAELDMPLHRHGIVVGNAEEGHPESQAIAQICGTYESGYFGHRSLFQLVLSGVFERHPQLKFVFTELGGTNWSLPEIQRLDTWVETSLHDPVLSLFGRSAAERLSMKPSEYFHRNVFLSTLVGPDDVASRHDVGIDRILWGADFPHHEGTVPYVVESLRGTMAEVPEDEVRQLTSGNAAHIYDIDLEQLQRTADRFGPAPELIATPLSPDELAGLSGLSVFRGIHRPQEAAQSTPR